MNIGKLKIKLINSILLLVISILLSINCTGQENQKLGVVYDYTVNKESIINTFYDNNTSNYLVEVLTPEVNSKLYLKGVLIATLNSKEGFIERIVGVERDNLCIVKFSTEERTTEISMYKMKSTSISKVKSKVINHIVTPWFINGRLVISDDFEGYGSLIEFFDQDFNSIIIYYPFEYGYYSFDVYIENNIANIYSSSLSSSGKCMTKFAKFDLSTREKIHESILSLSELDFYVKKTYKTSNGFVLFCTSITNPSDGMIVGADNEGGLLWHKEQLLLPLWTKGIGVFESSVNNQLFIITGKTKFLVINSISGEKLNEIDLNRLSLNNFSSNHIISSVAINEIGEIVILSGNLDWNKVDINSFIYKNNKIFTINILKNEYSVIEVESNLKSPKISLLNNSVIIKSEKRQDIIEKNSEIRKQINEQ